jgi:putative colanic acid biosynthesis UDP-glucose lipid carrier transferase
MPLAQGWRRRVPFDLMTGSAERPWQGEPHAVLPTDATDAPPESQVPSTISPTAFRLTGHTRSSVPPPAEQALILAITRVLLAAAAADGQICNREQRMLRRLLGQMLETPDIPDWLESEIEAFDPSNFEIEESCSLLRDIPREQRRHVLESVRAICDANNAFDLEEEKFLIGLVYALAMDTEDTHDLVVYPSRANNWVKRVFDFVFALTFLLLCWPLLIAIAVWIKLDSQGPVLFRQRRLGQDGVEVGVFKFRTMRVTEDGAKVVQATHNDPRITRVGAFLRRTSLDELPQFANVLWGDMSVVGPRPHAVAHNQLYRTKILEYMLRHKVKPGITGWAQVNGWRGETDTLDKMVQRVTYDLEYIRRQSFWFDCWIIFLTLFGKRVRQNAH